jgi:hypothetical protein
MATITIVAALDGGVSVRSGIQASQPMRWTIADGEPRHRPKKGAAQPRRRLDCDWALCAMTISPKAERILPWRWSRLNDRGRHQPTIIPIRKLGGRWIGQMVGQIGRLGRSTGSPRRLRSVAAAFRSAGSGRLHRLATLRKAPIYPSGIRGSYGTGHRPAGRPPEGGPSGLEFHPAGRHIEQIPTGVPAALRPEKAALGIC